MASKRKPLDDARRRVKEKLNAIDEQKDFIQNSVEQLTSGVIDLIINLNFTGYWYSDPAHPYHSHQFCSYYKGAPRNINIAEILNFFDIKLWSIFIYEH